jgi:hypothetical protein
MKYTPPRQRMPGRGAMNERTSTALLKDLDVAPIAPSRRGVLATLASGLFAGLPFALSNAGIEAKGGGKRRKRKKNKKNKKRKERGPQTRVDAACPGPRDNAFIVGSLARLAQTFTAGVSGQLVKAELGINHGLDSRGEYILRLSPVDGDGVPTDEVLAAAFVPEGDVATGDSTVTFTFLDPATVEANTQYALVLVRMGPGNFSWLSRAGDVCLGRGFLSDGLSAQFEPREGQDFVFTAFVRS